MPNKLWLRAVPAISFAVVVSYLINYGSDESQTEEIVIIKPSLSSKIVPNTTETKQSEFEGSHVQNKKHSVDSKTVNKELHLTGDAIFGLDSKEILALHEKYGSQFSYNENFWVEHTGDIDGVPVFNIAAADLFTDESYTASMRIFDFEVERLMSEDTYGIYDPLIEDRFRQHLTDLTKDVSDIKIDFLTCKRYKCMASLTYGEITSKAINALDGDSVHVFNLSNNYKCRTSRMLFYSNKYLISVSCSQS